MRIRSARRIGVLLLALLLPGCYDQMILEDTSLSLMIGLDVDDSNRLVVYSQSPVFYREAKEKSENAHAEVYAYRQSRETFDSMLTGLTSASKNQTLIIGKRVLAHPDWFRILDYLYRDPKQTSTPRVALIQGPVDRMFDGQPKNKPRMSLHMKRLLESAHKRNITVSTNIQDLRWQIKDRGITPSVSEIRRVNDVVSVVGTALLTKQGAYAGNLSFEDTTLLLLLQDRLGSKELAFAMPQLQPSGNDSGFKPVVTFTAALEKKRIKTGNAGDDFRFDVTLKFKAIITSIGFPVDMESLRGKQRLERQIADQMRERIERLIERCQQSAIDPFGFGRYARAYRYADFKKVQNDWGKTFARAKVNVGVRVNIKSIGAVE